MLPSDLRQLIEAATPGPWRKINFADWWEVQAGHDSPDYEMPNIWDNEKTERAEANADLVVAARSILPILLELWAAVEEQVGSDGSLRIQRALANLAALEMGKQ